MTRFDRKRRAMVSCKRNGFLCQAQGTSEISLLQNADKIDVLTIGGATESSLYDRSNLLPPTSVTFSARGLTFLQSSDFLQGYEMTVCGTTVASNENNRAVLQTLTGLAPATYHLIMTPTALMEQRYLQGVYLFTVHKNGVGVQDTFSSAFTVENESDVIEIAVLLNPALTAEISVDDTFYLQIRKDTYSEEYFPYCADVPNYRKIRSLGESGETVTKSGKNLFKEEGTGYVTRNGVKAIPVSAYDPYWITYKRNVSLKANTTYRISFRGFFAGTANVYESMFCYILYYADGTNDTQPTRMAPYNATVLNSTIRWISQIVRPTKDVIKIGIGFWAFGQEGAIEKSTLQIEKGSSRTTYDSYLEPKSISLGGYSLKKIGTVSDELQIGKKSVLIERIVKQELTGLETMTEDGNYFYIPTSQNEKAGGAVLCNFGQTGDVIISGHRIALSKTAFPMPSPLALQAFLRTKKSQNMPLCVYFEKENATRTPIFISLNGFEKLNFLSTVTYQVSGTLAPSFITCLYWGYGTPISKTLTVNYQTIGGATLRESETYTLRRGSVYCLQAPSVAGYTPTQNALYGILSENKTVTLYYQQ